MRDFIESLGDALTRDLNSLNQISQNIANVGTPGYKAISTNKLQNNFGEILSSPVQSSTQSGSWIKMSQRDGALRQTGRALDLAITGNAMFVVENNGEILYTRDGSLAINNNGVLVNKLNLPVLADTGSITFSDDKNIKFSKSGEIAQNGSVVGRLRLASFPATMTFQVLGNGLIRPRNENNVSENSFIIHQGYTEASNVNSTHEMVKLMEISKHFESTQKAISMYDQALSSGINKIGK